MATHPYISGPGNITQMIGYLRKTFPPTVSSETVRKLGLASKNESYVINALQFIGLIDEEGKRTDIGHKVLSIHDEKEFNAAFAELVSKAYSDLFDIRGEDAWTLSKDQLISYFRSADKTSEIIGSRQTGVFMALSELAGHQVQASGSSTKPKSAGATSKKPAKKPIAAAAIKPTVLNSEKPAQEKAKGDMALTVRIEINLPAEGSRETYDAIFKSIKANLFP